MRVGVGVDIHQLRTGQVMYLAGLSWPDEPAGLAGHSDGDVAAHACADALYSAAGLGDLGSNIGVDEPDAAGRSGVQILSDAARPSRAAGFEIANVAVQVIGNAPRIAARRAEAQSVAVGGAGRSGLGEWHDRRRPGTDRAGRGHRGDGHCVDLEL